MDDVLFCSLVEVKGVFFHNVIKINDPRMGLSEEMLSHNELMVFSVFLNK